MIPAYTYLVYVVVVPTVSLNYLLFHVVPRTHGGWDIHYVAAAEPVTGQSGWTDQPVGKLDVPTRNRPTTHH